MENAGRLAALLATSRDLWFSFLTPSSSRPRTPAFHVGNTGSNPVGVAKKCSEFPSLRRGRVFDSILLLVVFS